MIRRIIYANDNAPPRRNGSAVSFLCAYACLFAVLFVMGFVWAS